MTAGPVEPPKPSIAVILKADGVGSLRALQTLVENIASRTDDIVVSLKGASVGDVCKGDVERASSIDESLILCFNVGMADAATRRTASELDVSVFRDNVIYRLEDELLRVMEAKMPRIRSLLKEGEARVLQVFKLSDKAKVRAK